MTLYNASRLKQELEAAGCRSVVSDGIGALLSFAQWPNWRLLRYPFAFANRFIPAPKPVREKLGISVIAMGRVHKNQT
jgi:hypothetical protein